MSGNRQEYQLDYVMKLPNEFRVDGLDLAGFTFPKPIVKSWTTLSGEGVGSVTVEAEYLFPGEKYPTRFDLASTRLSAYGQKKSIVKYYESLVLEWNTDNRANWLRILREAVESVASHHEKQIVESRRKFDIATANLDWLASEED